MLENVTVDHTQQEPHSENVSETIDLEPQASVGKFECEVCLRVGNMGW